VDWIIITGGYEYLTDGERCGSSAGTGPGASIADRASCRRESTAVHTAHETDTEQVTDAVVNAIHGDGNNSIDVDRGDRSDSGVDFASVFEAMKSGKVTKLRSDLGDRALISKASSLSSSSAASSSSSNPSSSISASSAGGSPSPTRSPLGQDLNQNPNPNLNLGVIRGTGDQYDGASLSMLDPEVFSRISKQLKEATLYALGDREEAFGYSYASTIDEKRRLRDDSERFHFLLYFTVLCSILIFVLLCS